MPRAITAVAVEGLPEVRPGDDLPELITGALARQRETLQPGDVLVMAHKIVSKAEGRIRRLADVEPGPRALELGKPSGRTRGTCRSSSTNHRPFGAPRRAC